MDAKQARILAKNINAIQNEPMFIRIIEKIKQEAILGKFYLCVYGRISDFVTQNLKDSGYTVTRYSAISTRINW